MEILHHAEIAVGDSIVVAVLLGHLVAREAEKASALRGRLEAVNLIDPAVAGKAAAYDRRLHRQGSRRARPSTF